MIASVYNIQQPNILLLLQSRPMAH